MALPTELECLPPDQLRRLAGELMAHVAEQEARHQRRDHALRHSRALNEKLTHELALLKRQRFAQRSEQLNALQASLLDELIEADIAAIEAALETLPPQAAPVKSKRQPKRAALPSELPRTLIRHEPRSTQCR